jgi:hypothetical protein
MRTKLTNLIYKRDIGLWSDCAKIAIDTNRIDMFVDKLIEEDLEDSIRIKTLIGTQLYNQFRRLQKDEIIKNLKVAPTPIAYFTGIVKHQYEFKATTEQKLNIYFKLSEYDFINKFGREKVICSTLLKNHIIRWEKHN